MSHTREANLLKQVELLPKEIEVIIGCLIGDGSLVKSGKEYRLHVNHTVRHEDYVNWKYQLLQRMCLSSPMYIPITSSIRLSTVGHSYLTKVRDQWYRHGIKHIPNSFSLTPLMLAIWFMDDGCKHGKSVDFSVHSFSDRSISKLRSSLRKFGIFTTVNFDGKGHRIYVRRKSYDSFKELVKPYVVTCMAYKLL